MAARGRRAAEVAAAGLTEGRRGSPTAQAAELDPAERARFEAEPAAWRYFEAAPPGYRKTLLHWIVTAKGPETRARRLAELIRASAEQRRLR